MMRCAVVHMAWSAGIHGIKVQYSVSEIAAVSLDENLHTTDTFRFILDQSNGHVRSEKHFEGGKVVFAEQKEGWSKFWSWYRGHDYLVVWEKEAGSILDKKAGKRHKTVCAQKLFDSMTMGIPRKSNKMPDAMAMLGLRCDPDRVQQPLYCAQALVRLFRKLYTSGRREMGVTFHHGLMDGDYFYISRHVYFPQLKEKLRRERNVRIQELIENSGYSGSVSRDDIVSVKTKMSSWTFDLSETNPALKYVTRIFYRGVRVQYMALDRNISLEEKIEEILREIDRIERKFQAGVGNPEITELVELIARRHID